MKVTHTKAAYLDDHDLIIVRDAVQSYALTLRERMKQWNRDSHNYNHYLEKAADAEGMQRRVNEMLNGIKR